VPGMLGLDAMTATWSEGKIARILARATFTQDLCVLPRCKWTGDEIDLLVLTRACRLIDVEIKISRPDFRADKTKDKWWQHHRGTWVGGEYREPPSTKRAWPRHTWKHFYALPEEVWRPELLEHAQPMSGILLISEPTYAHQGVRVFRAATCNREAKPLGREDVMQLARLASLRMWDAYKELERT
jgi:hypothetical protein